MADFPAITDFDDGLVWSEQLCGGWQVGQYDSDELASHGEEFLWGLVEATGYPAVLAYVVDSDYAQVVGRSAQGRWSGFLDRPAARRFAAEYGFSIGIPEDALSGCLRWALDASLQAEVGRVRDLFESRESDPLAEDLFFELLDVLGLVDG